MALNPSSQANTAVEVIDGTVSEFYNVMDQCIRRSEVMPGQYKSITSPSYSNNCPIDESSFTTVDIGCPAPQVVDINNSFITATIEVPVHFPAGFKVHGNACTFFIGWRSSLDMLRRYIIYCNHKLVHDQVYVGEESFILQSLIPEHVRCRRPYQYTTYENASNFSPDVCGTYITLTSANVGGGEANKDDPADIGAFDMTVSIPIKLDINQFILFQNFKYLPGFCGTWSIKLYPSSQNMIICPVDPKVRMTAAELNAVAGKDLSDYDHHFVQIGDSVRCLTQLCTVASRVATVPPTFESKTITIGRARVKEVLYHQTQFELMYDIYDGLKARYMARPLTIPVNKLEYGRFSGAIKDNSSTYTSAVSNVESIFILPFPDDDHHTVCVNPQFENLYLSISGWGNFPQQPFNTFGNDEKHTRFVNMTLDALNINNSPIMAPNKDLLNSLETKKIDYYKHHYSGSAYTNTIYMTQPKFDNTNFLIGIPFSNDIDFQGGLTSNGNINIKLASTTNIYSDSHSEHVAGGGIGATVMFCSDCALMIKVIPYADQPEVRLVTEKIV